MENKCKKCKANISDNMDICPSCKRKSLATVIVTLFIVAVFFVTIFDDNSNNNQQIVTKQTYKYHFEKENKQLTGKCKRSEWIYTVENNIKKDTIPLILKEIYNNRKYLTDRTVITLYTKKAYNNILNNKVDIAIGVLTDGFNCKNPRKVKINNNWKLNNL